MRFFAKLVFLFNLCFLGAVGLRFIEAARRSKGNFDAVIPLPPLQNSLVVLGYSAIIVNLIFFVAVLVGRLTRNRAQTIPRWLLLANLVLLPVQVWYFFFTNF